MLDPRYLAFIQYIDIFKNFQVGSYHTCDNDVDRLYMAIDMNQPIAHALQLLQVRKLK